MYRLIILMFCLAASTSAADSIYKYVDAEGKVIYSETPPLDTDDVESLEPAQDISDDELKAAHDRQQKLQAYIDESASARERREAAKKPLDLNSPAVANTLPNFPPLAGH